MANIKHISAVALAMVFYGAAERCQGPKDFVTKLCQAKAVKRQLHAKPKPAEITSDKVTVKCDELSRKLTQGQTKMSFRLDCDSNPKKILQCRDATKDGTIWFNPGQEVDLGWVGHRTTAPEAEKTALENLNKDPRFHVWLTCQADGVLSLRTEDPYPDPEPDAQPVPQTEGQQP